MSKKERDISLGPCDRSMSRMVEDSNERYRQYWLTLDPRQRALMPDPGARYE